MKTKKMNSNTILLLITIALFVVMYAIGCVSMVRKDLPISRHSLIY